MPLPYFAYGSNMVEAQMAKRCPTARILGRAVLRNYRFSIFRSGFATVVPTRGASVHGLLWRLSPRDERVLDAYEEIDKGIYHRAVLPVEAEGRAAPALIYLAQDRMPGRAPAAYLRPIVEAARGHGFPLEAVAEIEAWFSP